MEEAATAAEEGSFKLWRSKRSELSDRALSADLIIFAVKFMGMESALEIVKPFVGEHTLFLSVLNGISSEEMIEKAYGADHDDRGHAGGSPCGGHPGH